MALTKVRSEQLDAAQTSITSVGTLTGLTVNGNIAGTLTTAAQTNITSVGTLSNLTTSGFAKADNYQFYQNSSATGATDAIYRKTTATLAFKTGSTERMTLDGSGNLVVTGGLTGSTLTGTLSTAAQTNITSVGTLTGLTSSGTLSVTNQVAIKEIAPGIESGHSSPHSMQVGRWVGSNDRWVIVPEPEGTPLYSRELTYHFTTDTWSVEGGFAATLSTAAQPNITSVGTLTGLTSSGNVLIDTGGTTSANPGLRVKGNHGAQALQQLSGASFYWNTSNGSQDVSIVYGASANSYLRIIHATGSAFEDRIRIDSSGNVGIGVSSIGSSTKLQVAGRGLFTDGLPDPADGSPAGVAIGYNTTSGYGFIQAIQTGVANKNLYVQPSGTNNVIIANSGGNVGIGTAAPSQTLHVDGAAKFEDDEVYQDTGDNFLGGLVFETPIYKEYQYRWSGQNDHETNVYTPSYFMSEIVFTQHQTNGGTDINRHFVGKFANNHTHHELETIHDSGGTWSMTTSMTATDHNLIATGGSGTGANGRLRIVETYGSGSYNSSTLTIRVYFGTISNITHTYG